jgi:hypothetical protein
MRERETLTIDEAHSLNLLFVTPRRKAFEFHLANLFLAQSDILSGNSEDRVELEAEQLGHRATYRDHKIYQKIIKTGTVSGLSGDKMTADTTFIETLITVSTGETDERYCEVNF